MSAPCVIARPLSEGERMLREAGVSGVVRVRTSPPGKAPGGPLRVVRQRSTGEGVELVASASVVLLGERDRSE